MEYYCKRFTLYVISRWLQMCFDLYDKRIFIFRIRPLKAKPEHTDRFETKFVRETKNPKIYIININ